MYALFRTFLRFWNCKNYWNPLRFDRVAVKCTLLRFINHGKDVGFNFFQVRCKHKSGDVVNFTRVACRISSRLKWYKNYKNWLRLAKVIVKNKLPRFYGPLCSRKDATFGSVVDNAARPQKHPLWGGGVDRHFQAKLADCGWMAVCRLQVDRFLPIAGEICFLREALLEPQ